jgi:hypothetical protein
VTPYTRPRVGHPVTSYTVQVACPQCGGHVLRCAEGTPGMDTRAVARCEPCRRHWGVVVELVDVTAEVASVKDYEAEYQRELERRTRRRKEAA